MLRTSLRTAVKSFQTVLQHSRRTTGTLASVSATKAIPELKSKTTGSRTNRTSLKRSKSKSAVVMDGKATALDILANIKAGVDEMKRASHQVDSHFVRRSCSLSCFAGSWSCCHYGGR